MKLARPLPVALLITCGLCATAHSAPTAAAKSVDELTAARQLGWATALRVVKRLDADRQPGFVGIEEWLKEFNEQTKGLDPQRPPSEWPKIDVDALATHNPKFWRAYYEIAPGDPGAALLYAGLLLGGGENVRALNVIEWQAFRPGIPDNARTLLGELRADANVAWKTTDPLVQEGIQLFDKGDYEGANAKYRAALRIWPQSSSAYYELAYTLRTQQILAAGEKPDNPGIDERVKHSPEVRAMLAECRRHSPFMLEGYANGDPETTRAYEALMRKIAPSMQYMAQRPDAPDFDQALAMLGEGCQEANVDDLALVARQILVARRGGFDAADHPFIVQSLRRLAPGPDTEATLARLAAKENLFYRLIPTKDVPSQAAPALMFKLGTPRYIQEKTDKELWTVVVPVEAVKAEYLEKLGLTIAYACFKEPIKTPPTDLKSDGQEAVLNTDNSGVRDLVWTMRSAQQGLTLQVHFFMNGPQHQAVGTKGVMRIGFRGLPDVHFGCFLFDGDHQNSNMIVFNKQDFTVGDGEVVFQDMVAKLSDATEPKE